METQEPWPPLYSEYIDNHDGQCQVKSNDFISSFEKKKHFKQQKKRVNTKKKIRKNVYIHVY